MPSLHRRDKQRKMLQTIEDPELFATAMLGPRLWSGQRAILRSVAAHRRTAVKACHASGKTFTAAQVALWWITCHSEAVAVTTAPTRMQVERLLWGEIHKA